MEVNERSEWKAPKLSRVCIDTDVWEILVGIIPDFKRFVIRNDKVVVLNNDAGYGFNFIAMSKSDKTRLSAFSYNYITKVTWEVSSPKTVGRLSEVFNALEDYYWYSRFDDSNRVEHGTHIKISGLIKKFFPDKSSDEISVLSGVITEKIRLHNTVDLSMVKISDKPSEIYTKNSPNFSSCMRNQDPQRFAIYDDLENTKIAYIEDPYGNLKARALIHKNVTTDTGETISIMDRVYANSSKEVAILLSYAKENGLFRKIYPDSSNCHTYIHPTSNTNHDFNLTMKTHNLKERKYKQVPYIDTFRYLVDDTTLTSNYETDHITKFERTDGQDNELYLIKIVRTCSFCGGQSEDAIRVGYDYICPTCHEQHYHPCPHCGVSTRNDGSADGLCRNCRENVFLCDVCNQYHDSYDLVPNSDVEGMMCRSCYATSAGINESDLSACSICGEFHVEDCEDTNIDRFVCNRCLPLVTIPPHQVTLNHAYGVIRGSHILFSQIEERNR